MFSNSVVISLAIVAVLGVLHTIAALYVFRFSAVRNMVLMMTAEIILTAVVGIIIGFYGVVHLLWAAPLVLIVGWVMYIRMAQIIRKPISKNSENVDKLSQGDIRISFETAGRRNEITDLFYRMEGIVELLNTIADFANKIGRGDLDVDYQQLNENDVLGRAMVQMRDNLKVAEEEKLRRQQEDERRSWITVGLAKFADLLRSNNDNMENLCNSIISNMVKYIGANQGGIFILNDENPNRSVLEMKACYAYERRKFTEKEIEPGEGLVGTCFLERQSIYMTKLPKGYIHITSGLGDEAPNALLITPLMVNEAIYGVIEIAAFSKFEPHVREFVEKVAESIASTVSSTKTAIRTQRLLEQSKLQAEEMANQEEELRQNMEEMQATQEEMQRKNQEAEQARIEHSKLMSENEYQLTKLSMVLDASKIGLWDMEVIKGDPVNPDNTFQWSDEFRHMLGYSSEADFPNILSSWSDKLHPEDKERTLDLFARHILDRTGKTPYDLEYRLLKKNGEYSYFHAFGATVRDNEGHALRVAGAIQDITEDKNTVEKIQAAQNEMRRREKELESMVGVLYKTSYVVEFTPDGKYSYINDKMLEVISAPREKLLSMGLSIFNLVAEKDLNGVPFKKHWEAALKGKELVCPATIVLLTGQKFNFNVTIIPVFDERNAVNKVIGVLDPIK